MALADLIAAGKEFGIFQFYLPFIIMFAILYGLLRRAKIFGEQKNIDMIIALAASLFVMVFTPAGITLTEFFANFFGGTLIVFVTILAFLLITFMIAVPLGGGKAPDFGKAALAAVIAGGILAVGVFVLSGGLAIFPGLTFGVVPAVPVIIFPGISTADLAILIVVLLTVLALIFLARGEGKKEEKKS
jgi:hypothetical protein